jgi:hypothetical protein
LTCASRCRATGFRRSFFSTPTAATTLSSVTFFPVFECPPHAADHGDVTVGCRAGKAGRIARGTRCRPSGQSRWTGGNVHDVGVPPRPRTDE